jgi:3-oxoacyl-[acyl-carrier-protein] synthase-3
MDGISVYVPPARLSVEEMASEIRKSGHPFPDDDIVRLRSQHRFDAIAVETALSCEEMANRACEPLLQELLAAGKFIDRIIIVHTSQLMRHDTSLLGGLLRKHGLEHLQVISLTQQNCSNVHMALYVIQRMFMTDPRLQGILLLSVDLALHPLQWRIPESLNGDNACACYLSRESGCHWLLSVVNETDGLTYDGINASRQAMDWFNFTYYFSLRRVFRKAVEQAGCLLDDIRLIIGSNVNFETWSKLSRMLPFPLDRIYTKTISRVGHLYGSDLLYNIQEAISDGTLRDGDCYATLTVGLGGAYGCSIHRYVKEASSC